MSVITRNRGQNSLLIFKNILELRASIIKLVRNEKYFKLRYKDQLVLPILDLIKQIHYEIYTANNIRLDQIQEQKLRYNLQKQALNDLALLQSELTMNYLFFGLPAQKAQYFIQKINHENSLLLAWIRSDKNRINNKNNQEN